MFDDRLSGHTTAEYACLDYDGPIQDCIDKNLDQAMIAIAIIGLIGGILIVWLVTKLTNQD